MKQREGCLQLIIKDLGLLNADSLLISSVLCVVISGSIALCETRLRQPVQENDDTLPIIARNRWSKSLMSSASICETVAGKPVTDTLQVK